MSLQNSCSNVTPSCPLKTQLNTSGNNLEKENTSGETLIRTNRLMDVLGNKYLFAEIYKCHTTWKYRDAHKRRMKPILALIKNMGLLYSQIQEQDKDLITDEEGKQVIGFSDLRRVIATLDDLPKNWVYDQKILFSLKHHIIRVTTKKFNVASMIVQSDRERNIFWIDYINYYGWYNYYNMDQWKIFLKEWDIRYDGYLRKYVFY